MVESKSSRRKSFLHVFSNRSNKQTPAPLPSPASAGTLSPRRPPTSRGNSSSSEDGKSYARHLPAHASRDAFSMVTPREAADANANPYRMTVGRADAPVFFGHRDLVTDYTSFLTQAEITSKRTSSSTGSRVTPRINALPKTSKVMDDIMAAHAARQAKLYSKDDYLKTERMSRAGLMF